MQFYTEEKIQAKSELNEYTVVIWIKNTLFLYHHKCIDFSFLYIICWRKCNNFQSFKVKFEWDLDFSHVPTNFYCNFESILIVVVLTIKRKKSIISTQKIPTNFWVSKRCSDCHFKIYLLRTFGFFFSFSIILDYMYGVERKKLMDFCFLAINWSYL